MLLSPLPCQKPVRDSRDLRSPMIKSWRTEAMQALKMAGQGVSGVQRQRMGVETLKLEEGRSVEGDTD